MNLRLTSVSAMLALLLAGALAHANQFPVQDPTYTQQIYTGPLGSGEGGFAWTSGNNLLTRQGSNIIVHSLTQNTTHLGTNLHGAIATYNIPNLNPGGVGMTNGLDGYVYAVTSIGLQRFDPNNLATTTAQTLPGTVGGNGWGVTTLPDGRIAYSDGGAGNVYVYNPVSSTNTLIYSAPGLVDGMVAGPTGNLALAIQSNSAIVVITNTGAPVNSFNTTHYPDGLAFASSPAASILYSNNNDGTITKYVLGPGYTGVPVTTDIFSGSKAYGDLASVGPDCAFYVSQYENGSLHGATPGVGTNWDNGTTNAEASYVRIGGGVMADGTTVCDFYSPLTSSPEPGSASLLLTFAALGLGARLRQAGKN
ncbi:MAG: hypothetical protein JWL69_312 [Phycisphaerales bacterium]|nr:hypothetical protein [Phycisphaerales bacterium]